MVWLVSFAIFGVLLWSAETYLRKKDEAEQARLRAHAHAQAAKAKERAKADLRVVKHRKAPHA